MDTALDINRAEIQLPASDMKLLRDMARKMGWTVKRKKSGLEEADEDIRRGRISKAYESSDELLKDLGVNV